MGNNLILGELFNHVKLLSSIHSLAAKFKIWRTICKLKLIVLFFLPSFFLASIKGCKVPICTASIGRSPICLSNIPSCSASDWILFLCWFSAKNLVAASLNFRLGRAPYTATCLKLSIRLARYFSASSSEFVQVLSQIRCPKTCLSTCQDSPRL